MKRRRVKITGVGFVTPAGIGKEEFWKGILEPVSRVGALKRFPEEAGAFVAAEVKGFRLENYVDGVANLRMARHTQFALAAAILAVMDAGLKLCDLQGRSPAIIVGASLMDFGAINKGIELILRRGPVSALPRSVFSASVSAIGGAIGDVVGGAIRSLALQSACCAGLDSIGYAADLVANGEANLALCGGTEAPLFLHPMLELKGAGLAPGNPDNPEKQCRPFDQWRTTGVIGEGACVVLLEPDESPRKGYAYIDGYAFASDPAENPGAGLSEAIRVAIANAGLRAPDIECINAWGPGHKVVDAAEAKALVDEFGNLLPLIPAVSIKGSVGNALAAAGAIQVGCAAVGMAESVIPPTVNWQYPDPTCPLNLSGRARFIPHSVTLIDAHGLSGTNACLVLTR